MAPDSCRWLLLIQTHAFVGSRWLPMTPIDFHRVSLLLNHYPQAGKLDGKDVLEAKAAAKVSLRW